MWSMGVVGRDEFDRKLRWSGGMNQQERMLLWDMEQRGESVSDYEDEEEQHQSRSCMKPLHLKSQSSLEAQCTQ